MAAKHYDEFISKPMKAFAEALSNWQALMERCVREIDANRAIASSFRRRRHPNRININRRPHYIVDSCPLSKDKALIQLSMPHKFGNWEYTDDSSEAESEYEKVVQGDRRGCASPA